MNVSDENPEHRWGPQLTRLLFGRLDGPEIESVRRDLDHQEEAFIKLCKWNRIIVRTLIALQDRGVPLGARLEGLLQQERQRIERGMEMIGQVSRLCDEVGVPFVVMKTLDQYPDQGHDVDIFIDEGLSILDQALRQRLGGQVLSRSLSDCLARKRSYMLPGSLTLEVHCARLGQVGEHNRLGSEILRRRRSVTIAGVTTSVPSPEGQLLLAMLQRVYRHFFFRICDVYNMVRLVTESGIGWETVPGMSQPAGIYPGTLLGLAWLRRLMVALGSEDLAARFPPLPSGGLHDLELRFHHSYFQFPRGRVILSVYSREALAYMEQLSLASVARLVALVPLVGIVWLNMRALPSLHLWRKLW